MIGVRNVQTILLIIALSIDLFLACVACGTEKIKIEKKAALCISGICSGVLLLSLTAGAFFQGIIAEQYTDWICFAGLFLVGAFKLGEYLIRAYIRKNTFLCKRIKISFSQLNFILSIYNNPVVADRDHSESMSVSESVFFALAMSMDGLFGGLGAGFLDMNIGVTTVLNFAVGFLAVQAGSYAGRCAALRSDMDLSWIGGVLFLILAFGKIL